MRQIDGPLSRRAQTMLGDPSALIYVVRSLMAGHPWERDPARRATDARLDRPRYVLERAGHEPVDLGATGGLAYTALVALRAAHRAACAEEPDDDVEPPSSTDLREAAADIRYHEEREDGVR